MALSFEPLERTHKLGNIPEIVNDNFERVCKYIKHLYDETSETLHCMTLNTRSTVKCNTIQASNVIINLGGGEKISLSDFIANVNILHKRYCSSIKID